MAKLQNNGERLATLETEVKNIQTGMTELKTSVDSLHGKFDVFIQNYVAKDTFEEYKKNKWLERILLIIITAGISGLIAFFLREYRI